MPPVSFLFRSNQGEHERVPRGEWERSTAIIKLNRSAEAAMRQIDLKDYPARFALCGLPVVKIGINFDAQKHTLTDWKIEQ
ncbi:MAG: hypothetical protein PUE17_09225 [Bacteroidales bacterium]|nr:hypothetical protein [Bacteroidales bacterium]MDY4558738.1 hypothetical protein [Alloprevotella sp.]